MGPGVPASFATDSTTTAHPRHPPARQGQNVKVVSERLGHASASFTLDRYSHVLPGLQASAASAVAALVDGS